MSKDFFPKHARRHRKTSFFARIFPDLLPHFSCIFSQFVLLFPPKCDTCDSKKTTLRLECAHLCAPMRAREKRSPKNFLSTFFLVFSSSSFLLSWFLLFSFLTSLSSFFLLLSSSFLLPSLPLAFPFFSSGARDSIL